MFCIHLWGKKSAPYMQTLHFAFGIGAFIAPLLAKPFLSPIPANTTIITGNIPTLTHLPYQLPPTIVTNETLQHRVRRGESSLTMFNVSTTESRELNQTDKTSTTPTLVLTTLPKKPEVASDKHLKADFNDGKHMKEVSEPTEDDENEIETLETKNPAEKNNSTAANNTELDDNQRNFTSSGFNTSTVSTTVVPSSTFITNVTNSVTMGTETANTDKEILNGNDGARNTDDSSETENKDSSETATDGHPKVISQSPESEANNTEKTGDIHESEGGDKTDQAKDTIKQAVTNQPGDLENTSNTSDVISDKETEVKLQINTPNTTVNISETGKKPETVTDVIGGAISAMKNMSRIQFAYLIIGLQLFIISILFLGLYCANKHHSLALHSTDDKAYMNRKESMGMRVTILFLLFLFFFMYVGMEVTYGGLILSFTVQHLKWSKDQAAIVTAIFWGSLAVGRGVAIFVTRCFKPQCMLIVDLLFCLIGTIILCFGVPYYEPLLWAGTLMLGLGMSSVFPTGLSWAENYLHLTGKSTAVFVVGSALGEMVIPLVTGHLFQFVSKMALMYVMLVLTNISLVLFTLMQCAASRLHSAPVRSSSLMALKDDVMDLETFNSTGAFEGLSKRHKNKSTFDEVEYGLLEQELED